LQDVIVIAQRCIDAQLFIGNADDLAVEVWSVVHGVTSLVIAGMLDETTARARLTHLMDVVVKGNLSQVPS
jgi:hypothetical protein